MITKNISAIFLYKFIFTDTGNIVSICILLLLLAIVVSSMLNNNFNHTILEGGVAGPQRGQRRPCMRDLIIRKFAGQYAIAVRYRAPNNVYHDNNHVFKISPNSAEGLFLARHSNRVSSFSLDANGRVYQINPTTGRRVVLRATPSTIVRILSSYPRD